MNQQLTALIELCLLDGIITDKEREVIFRKAKELGVPQDECEIIVDAMLYQKRQSLNTNGENAPDIKQPGGGPEIKGDANPSDKNTTIDFRETLKQIDESVKEIANNEFINLISQDTLLLSWNKVKSSYVSDLSNLRKGSRVIVQSILSGFYDPTIQDKAYVKEQEYIIEEELTEASRINACKEMLGEIKWGDRKTTIKSIRPHPLNVIYKYLERGIQPPYPYLEGGSILGRNLKFSEKYRDCILPANYLDKGNPEKILISNTIEGKTETTEYGAVRWVDKQLVIMFWSDVFLGVYIQYYLLDHDVYNEKGFFGIDHISGDARGKYKFNHISVGHDFLGVGHDYLDLKSDMAKAQFTTKDLKRRLHLMNINTPTYNSFFQTYEEELKKNKQSFDVELKSTLNNLTQIQNNLKSAFSNKNFGYELIKKDLYNLIRNTSEFILKLNPLLDDIVQLQFESVFDLAKYEDSVLLKYNNFLLSFEKVMQHQYLINNMLDNFSTKETEQKYMMFKSDIEKSGLFLTTYENSTIEILNNINISISDLRNTVEYYGQQQIRMMEQMNIHLQSIDHNSQRMVGSLNQLEKNTGATNFILALQFMQDYRRNKILRRIEKK